jgi:hypothetical protein
LLSANQDSAGALSQLNCKDDWVWDSGINHTGVFDRFDGARQAGTSGFYAIFGQQLVWEIPEEPDDNQGLATFLQIGTADKSVSDVDLHLGAGLVWHGLIPRRNFDGLGLCFSYVRFSSEPGADFSTNGELATELFYKMQWTPWCYTTFDLQHIHDSEGDASLSDALVGTIRAGFLFLTGLRGDVMNEPSTVATPSRMKTLIRRVRSLLLLTVVIVVGAVVLQNTEQDHVRMLSMTIQMPKAGLLAGTLLTGFVLGLLWSQRFRK